MKIKTAVFEISAPTQRAAPRLALPEFAFIGRSNVGKSSLINLLAERRDLARVSNLPGKTRLINFFAINGNWRLVDLPGYGYAHVAKTERADFNEATADYLENRENLLHTFVLIDSRLPPQGIDREFLRWLDGTGAAFSVVFTKTDKHSANLTRTAVERFTREVLAGLAGQPATFLSSATTKAGRNEILAHIAAVLAEHKRAVPAAG